MGIHSTISTKKNKVHIGYIHAFHRFLVMMSTIFATIFSTIFTSIMFQLWFWFSNFVYYSIESVNFIGFVFDNSSGTIGLFKRIRTFNFITIAFFVLLLLITGVWVIDGVVELVFGWSLRLFYLYFNLIYCILFYFVYIFALLPDWFGLKI